MQQGKATDVGVRLLEYVDAGMSRCLLAPRAGALVEMNGEYENVVGNTIRFDDTDGELYSKIYDGCLQATISYGCYEDGMGWNPFGHWCGECTNSDCHGCPNEFVGLVREENE